jgi:pyruvate/2-oxoglutarate dehydrogenase complex dihydrolipoamide acyltransferase (E2) component
MSWFLKALLAIVLIVFAIDAKSWIGKIWGIALDKPTSRWEEVVEGREAAFEAAVRSACEQVATELSREPTRVAVQKVHVATGGTVERGQLLAEVTTPRALWRVDAPAAGKIKLWSAAAGQVVAPRATVGELEYTSTEAGKPTVVTVPLRVPTSADAVEAPLPLTVLTLGEDIQRRGTAALEAALTTRHWKLESRSSLSDAMSQVDLRSMLEQLWDRVSPSDIFARHDVERIAFGRIAKVEYPSDQRCEVEVEVRGLDVAGQLLFTGRATGVHGPEPGLADWVAAHPWRVLGLVLLTLFLVLLFFTGGRAVPYVERAREEAKDEQAVAAGRQVTQRLQDVLTDLRRHQTSASTRSLPAVANALAVQVDRIDQIRQRIESASRAQHRAAAATGMWPEFMVTDLASTVRAFPATGNEAAGLGAAQSIARAVDALRDTVHTKTNV